MPSQPSTPKEFRDGLLTFQGGLDHNTAPELLPRTQLHDAVNTSLRGDFAKPRSYFQKRALIYIDPSVKPTIDAGWVQGGCYYKPDLGPECLILSVSGRLYQFTILPDRANVIDVTGSNAQLATSTQCWLWQAEKWVIWNDGVSSPVFYTSGAATARSNYGTQVQFSEQNTAAFVIPAIGATVNVTFSDVTNLVDGDIVTVQNRGTFSVQSIAGAVATLLNINATPTGQNVPVPAADNLFWQHTGTQLPPGRIGTYGLGRNWMSLTDGKQFVGSDASGGSSGTIAENFRDACLNITENFYLAGGGNFAVPGSYGSIQAMRFAATLDASLGQGPLQVFTPYNVFSVNSPGDRLTWQDITNPILTESLIAGGAMGQDSTISANGDIMMRSLDGIRSLILGRREFATWGNTPISAELDPTLSADSQDLLAWGSAIIFDNRFLMTAGTVLGPSGPYFNRLVALNFDPQSSLRGKEPSIYDARFWLGLNVYKLFVGIFGGVERAFAFCFNTITNELELYEILPEESTAVADNAITPVTWVIESGTLDFGEPDPRERTYKKLLNGEIWVDDLVGTVRFKAYWKPDQWPYWVGWAQWEECATIGSNGKPQFRPRMGLGEPSGAWCDANTNRPLREGYTFQFKLEVTGHCTFKGARFAAMAAPEPRFAPPTCIPLCP